MHRPVLTILWFLTPISPRYCGVGSEACLNSEFAADAQLGRLIDWMQRPACRSVSI